MSAFETKYEIFEFINSLLMKISTLPTIFVYLIIILSVIINIAILLLFYIKKKKIKKKIKKLKVN